MSLFILLEGPTCSFKREKTGIQKSNLNSGCAPKNCTTILIYHFFPLSFQNRIRYNIGNKNYTSSANATDPLNLTDSFY